MATKTIQPDWFLTPEGKLKMVLCMISVERTTRNRHFLRGSNGAIGSTTTRTRTIDEWVMLCKEMENLPFV
jgi:hypothetical protein